MDEVDQDRHGHLVAPGAGGDRVDLGVVAVYNGEPGPQMVRVAAVCLGEGLTDHGRDRLAGRGEHRLALGPGAVTGGRGPVVSTAGRGGGGAE